MRSNTAAVRASLVLLAILAASFTGCAADGEKANGQSGDDMLRLNLVRSRPPRIRGASAAGVEVGVNQPPWDPKKTAIIVCDMWDHHWCKSAESRVGELAGPMNDMLKAARAKGVFVIHAPSTCTKFYEGTRARKLAQDAPFSPTPVPLAASPRWGTAWCWPDGKREKPLPIDDSDMGCDCEGEKCEIRAPWTRQIDTIEIVEGDAVTDDGQEAWNLLQRRAIDNVILCGVHLNMCVLGRPFAIRQMVTLGKNVALMRDMTDTMYNPERPPGVSHFDGTDLMVRHVEKYWCPSFESSDITGKAPFRFEGDSGGLHTGPATR